MKHITILAIETSCDDTSASIISDGIIQSNIISSQLNHTKLGGVVPEIASREHQKNIIFIVEKALNEANKRKKDLDAVAFTNGPGLLGSLLVGASFAKSFKVFDTEVSYKSLSQISIILTDDESTILLLSCANSKRSFGTKILPALSNSTNFKPAKYDLIKSLFFLTKRFSLLICPTSFCHSLIG